MKKYYSRLFLAVLPLVSITCSSLLPLAGTESGSETKNGYVVGYLSADGALPAPGVPVTLLPAGYNPLVDGAPKPSNIDTTDAFGRYHFLVADSGLYTLETPTGFNKAYRDSIRASADTTRLSMLTLSSPGTIVIDLRGIATTNGTIGIAGTLESVLYKAGDSTVVLTNAPAGHLAQISFVAQSAVATATPYRYDVVVSAGAVTQLRYPGWRFSNRIVLNTSPSGAGVAETVTNFPVLVRLNSTNLNFADAKTNGDDCRFTKADGISPLPYEIEQWDAENKQAAIWVKVDTVAGNNSVQSILMYWGNMHASLQSSGNQVFDTASGFSGVWHLNVNCDDQTLNTFNGTNFGADDTSGIIGMCKKFDGTDSIQINGLLGRPGSITLSAWVRCDTNVDSGGEIISLGDHVLIRADDNVDPANGVHASYMNGIPPDTFSDFESTQIIAGSGWHYVVFVFDSLYRSQSLFVDGVQRVQTFQTTSIIYDGRGQNTFLGHHGYMHDDYNLRGLLDEVRVYHKAVSADWVALCFRNQKLRDVLVQFR